MEMEKIIDDEILFSEENLIDDIRERNKWKCFKIIGDYLIENPTHKNNLLEYFSGRNLVDTINLVLINYVMQKAKNNHNYKDVNFTNIPECILFQK